MSDAEEMLDFHLRAAGLTDHVREHRFAPPRRWRFDFAFLVVKLAIEVEGGTFIGGRHTRGPAFEADCEKANAAVLAGWRLLRFTPHMIESGTALTVIEQALGRDKTSDR